MREEISAGGVVLFGNAILLLRKFNGDWVLPKGRIEAGEQKKEAVFTRHMWVITLLPLR